MSAFDIVILTILLASGGLGYLHGALRSVASLASLILALGVAFLGLGVVAPLISARLDPDWIARPLAFLFLFAASYVAFRLVGAGLADGLRQARFLNALDRAFGFLLGLVRATLFLGVCNLVFTAVSPPGATPVWLKDSLFYPLTVRSADLIRRMTPKGLDLAARTAPDLGQAVNDAFGDRHKGDTKAGGGYDTPVHPDRDKAAETPW